MFHFYLHLIFTFYPTCHLALPPVFITIYNTSNTHLLFTLHVNSLNELSPQQSHFFLVLLLLKCFTIYSCSFMSSNSAHILATFNWSLSFLTWKTWLSPQILKYLWKVLVLALQRKPNETQKQLYVLQLQFKKSSTSAKSKSIFAGTLFSISFAQGLFPCQVAAFAPTHFNILQTVQNSSVCESNLHFCKGRKRSNVLIKF